MACYSPLPYFIKGITPSMKSDIVVLPRTPLNLEKYSLRLPCSRCVGCRLERSRQWAVRCMHESSLYENNCFITLTYAPEFLPKDGSLNVRDFQLFMKRLRKRFGDGIRFFHCGEYGAKFRRPHYHAILFNFDFDDKYLWKEDNGYRLYRSPTLEVLWPYGHVSVGSATFESAAYVARYILKKVTGDAADAHYLSDIDFDTGECKVLKPEYTTMSRRPGIAKGWFDQFSSDVYPADKVVVRQKVMKPPRYYDSQFELLYPEEMERIKDMRKANALLLKSDSTESRLDVRRRVKEKQIVNLVRNVDKEL